MGQPRIVVVRSRLERDAALEAASGAKLRFLSEAGAAAFLGAAGFRALLGEHWPEGILDCGEAPGFALEALRLGARSLVLAPELSAFPALERLAREAGAEILPVRPPAIALGRIALDRPAGRAHLRRLLALHASGRMD
ncbi:hypothetical protein [Sabulicella glaciei]|uniref:Uroporphyrinogen-III synthase n=1 Tax=Sabulicella glaciei TaxID=2984948 RepID=A0ABT3NYL8_9PROT|nr:hypothetical protein [Roseococcus sp. MDT2-1-1]MCW8087259.1 hypothetical protein [Roseococcus sp. MDT2-1-1]